MRDEASRHEHTVGRYMLFGEIGAGGMATVHLGRRVGPAGFSRTVAIKRLHPHLAREREFVDAFLDEARIAARVSHPNVVSIDDVVIDGKEVLLVMEYVNGRALSALAGAERSRGRAVPPAIAAAIGVDMLHGLQAAHEACDERGRLLGLVHRDVSPQNVLVGVDGIARVLDFGIAKALGRLHSTETGSIKGKLAYMAPERLTEAEVTPRVDIYGAAIVIWELLAGERYFRGSSDEARIPAVLSASYRHLQDPALMALDAVLERALRHAANERHASCGELAIAIERASPAAPRSTIKAWVQEVAGAELAESAAALSDVERISMPFPAPTSQSTPELAGDTSARVARAEEPPAPLRDEAEATRQETPGARRLAGVAGARPEEPGPLLQQAIVTEPRMNVSVSAVPSPTARRRYVGLIAASIAAGIGGLAYARFHVANASPSAEAPLRTPHVVALSEPPAPVLVLPAASAASATPLASSPASTVVPVPVPVPVPMPAVKRGTGAERRVAPAARTAGGGPVADRAPPSDSSKPLGPPSEADAPADRK